MDGYIPFLMSEFGIKTLSGRVEYQWLTHRDLDRQTNGMVEFGGGAAALFAASDDPVHIHELVHAVVYDVYGVSLPFFMEGVATAYQRRLTNEVRFPPLRDPTDEILLERESLNYGVAGTFTAFLMTRRGPAAFFDLYHGVRDATTLAQVDDQMRRVYGSDLAALVQLFLSEIPCTDDEFILQAYDCAATELAWTGETWEHSMTLDCNGDAVYGGIGEFPALNAISVTLQVETPAIYELQAVGEEDVTVRLGPCFSCPWELADTILVTNMSTTVALEPGSYFVRIEADSELVADVDLSLTPSSNP
jgi:hypothetical protein